MFCQKKESHDRGFLEELYQSSSKPTFLFASHSSFFATSGFHLDPAKI